MWTNSKLKSITSYFHNFVNCIWKFEKNKAFKGLNLPPSVHQSVFLIRNFIFFIHILLCYSQLPENQMVLGGLLAFLYKMQDKSLKIKQRMVTFKAKNPKSLVFGNLLYLHLQVNAHRLHEFSKLTLDPPTACRTAGPCWAQQSQLTSSPTYMQYWWDTEHMWLGGPNTRL